MKFAVFSNVQQKRDPQFGLHPRPDDRARLAKEGTVAPEDLPPGKRLQYMVAEAVLADELDFDYFFTGEHHFSRGFSCVPTQATALTLVAQATNRIRLGPMVVILPINDPLRVAEDMVWLDNLSDGRLEVGIGKGVVPHELIAYGVDAREAQARTFEGMEVLTRAWTSTERFSFLGKFNQYYDVETSWPPIQKPHPPMWYPTQTPATAAAMAARGISVGVFSWHGVDDNKPVIDAFVATRSQMDLGPDDLHMGMLSSIVVAESDDEAEELARQNFGLQIALFQFEIERSKSYVVGTADRNALDHLVEVFEGMVRDFDQSSKDFMIIYGKPETVAEQLADMNSLGVDTVIGEFDFGFIPLEKVLDSMRLFSDRVIPAVRSL